MSQVLVTINGHPYKFACDDGQEPRLRRLAQYVDARVSEFVAAVGQVGDAKLLLLVALAIADELADANEALQQERIGSSSAELANGVHGLSNAVEAIAAREGWQCYRCNRGPFHVIEVWVENESMVEILPPEFAAEYLAFTRPDKVTAAMAAAVPATSRHRPA